VVDAAGRECRSATRTRSSSAYWHTKMTWSATTCGRGRAVAVSMAPMALKRFVNGPRANHSSRRERRTAGRTGSRRSSCVSRRPDRQRGCGADAAPLVWVVNLAVLTHPIRSVPRILIIRTSSGSTLTPCPHRVATDHDVAMVAKSVLEDFGLTPGRRRRARGLPHLRPDRTALAVHRRPPAAVAPPGKSNGALRHRHQQVVERGTARGVRGLQPERKDRTIASAYSIRPLPDARVSTPLRWDEVADVTQLHSPSTPCRRGCRGEGSVGRMDSAVGSSMGCSAWPNGRGRGLPDAPWPRISSGRRVRTTGPAVETPDGRKTAAVGGERQVPQPRQPRRLARRDQRRRARERPPRRAKARRIRRRGYGDEADSAGQNGLR